MSTLTLNDTFTGKNIASAASVYDYTILTAGAWRFQVALTNAAGNGDYVFYVKRQRGGAGTARPVLPKTTATATSGETDFEAATITVDLSVNDIVSIFVDGLAGDTSVNGIVEGWRDDYNTTTPPTAAAIATQVDTTLSASHGSGAWGESGSGAITFTYTLTDSVTANPIADAAVDVYSDVGMTALVTGGRTDAQGQVVFYLDAGTYYFKRVKTGYSFTNPDTEVVS